ncbi:MAG TPA: YihY/virulence factor BrkB family protein [Terriglobales bacterium]|nr:YihY/virulence factor BrkB family protein [Terriglobales bacterium]
MTSNLFDLHGVPVKEAASRTWSEIRADDVFGRAAQLAYYFFLALFPFLIFVIASLSVFGSADRGRMVLFGLFARILPRPAFQLIRDTFNEIIQSGGPLKMSLGILVSVWSASMGMTAIMDTLNAAYRLKETRSLLKQYMIAIVLTIAVAMLLVFSTAIVVLVDGFIAEHVFGPIAAFVWHAMEWLLTLAVLFLAFEITYYFAPNSNSRRWYWISPGAILGIILLILTSGGLRVYLRYSGNYDVTYGSLGAVIVLLLSFYLGGLAVLSGGALNGVLERIAAADVRKPLDVHKPQEVKPTVKPSPV